MDTAIYVSTLLLYFVTPARDALSHPCRDALSYLCRDALSHANATALEHILKQQHTRFDTSQLKTCIHNLTHARVEPARI